jgi:hypothetical protein
LAVEDLNRLRLVAELVAQALSQPELIHRTD